MSANRRNEQVAQQPINLDDVSTVLVRAGVDFAKRHYMLTSSWILGLLLIMFATGYSVTAEQEESYNRILMEIDYKKLQEAQHHVYLWNEQYYNAKGWFTCDEKCMDAYDNLQAARDRLAAIVRENESIMSRAKQEVGLFSEYGVQEARDLFWEQFAGGKDFAKRSSWYDLIFMSIGSMGRDESLIEFALRFLFNMLLNFTVGLIGALVGFYWYLWGIISSYEPNVLFAVGFFMLASVAATSLVASYLLGLYSAAAGSVFVAAKIGQQGAQRLADEQRRQQEFLNYARQQQQRHQHQE